MNIENLITLFLSNQGKLVIDALVELGFASSKSDAKRQIQQNSIKIGDRKVFDIGARIFNINNSLVWVETAKDGKIDIWRVKQPGGCSPLLKEEDCIQF